jgi:hypothetical protein
MNESEISEVFPLVARQDLAELANDPGGWIQASDSDGTVCLITYDPTSGLFSVTDNF